VDDDGYYWFVGRSDDVISSGAYRIGPFEVESALLAHAAVAESAVVGSPDADRGNVVKAFVVLRAGYEPGEGLATELKNIANALPRRTSIRARSNSSATCPKRAREDPARRTAPSRTEEKGSDAGFRLRLTRAVWRKMSESFVWWFWSCRESLTALAGLAAALVPSFLLPVAFGTIAQMRRRCFSCGTGGC